MEIHDAVSDRYSELLAIIKQNEFPDSQHHHMQDANGWQ